MISLTGWLVIVLALFGCRKKVEDDKPPPPQPERSEVTHALGSADSENWVQTLWFEGRLGERVEALFLSTEAGSAMPVVTLSTPDGARRALRLEGPGLEVMTQATTRSTSRTSMTAALEGRGLRAVLGTDKGGASILELTDTREGGRKVLVRDPGSVSLRHPSFAPDGTALYLDDGGALGGVWRVGVPDGPVTRIVPEDDASTPVAWQSDGEARVAFVEDSDPPRVWVARPPEALPLRPAVEVRREGRFPSSLVVLLQGPSGLLVPTPCEGDELATVDFDVDADNVRVGAARATHARFCGRGCVELYGTSPAGAPRLVARLEKDAPRWTAWFGIETGLTGGTYGAPGDLDGVSELSVCAEPVLDTAWLVTPRGMSAKGETFTLVEPSEGALRVYGTRPGVDRVYGIQPDGRASYKRLLTPREVDDAPAMTEAGDVSASVVDGALVWTEVATGAARTLLEASEGVELHEPTFDASGDVLWVADRGEDPGLLRIDLTAGEGTRPVGGAGIHRPVVLPDGHPMGSIAWLEASEGRWKVLTARPMSDRERRTLEGGPISLTGVTPSWTAVTPDGTRLVRCAKSAPVEIGIDDEGGHVVWSGRRVPVRAALYDGSALRLVEVVDDRPGVIAELLVGTETAAWVRRRLDLPHLAPQWLPTPAAEDLPMGGACRPLTGEASR